MVKEHSVFAVVFEDTEGARDVSIRYLTGHPSDAILIITQKGESVLTAWDENLMKEKAKADRLIPYTTFERKKKRAIKDILSSFSYAPKNAVVELPSVTIPDCVTEIGERAFKWCESLEYIEFGGIVAQ